jgi:nucleotide-binding universal stress UspA family protein
LDTVKEYLSLHGVTASVRAFACGSSGKGEALLKEAAKAEADLLAIGGYGHSRLRETVFGGVTAHVLSHATMPVLLVH